MITKKVLTLLTIGACLVGLSALGSQKNPVTRPLKSHGQGTMIVSLVNGSFVASEEGEGTHAGHYITHFEGEMDLVTGNIMWMEGYVEAANGDRQFGKLGPDGLLYITGGTGRFEGTTGSATVTSSDMAVTVDPIAGTMTITSTGTVEGTITY